MADRSTEPWYPTAAYLYVLHLDGPALAWEYLRRNPDYRLDWLHHRRRPEVAQRWDMPALTAKVIASQKRRRFHYAAQSQGAAQPWDHQPYQPASQRYMRNHIDLDTLEARARFPIVRSAQVTV